MADYKDPISHNRDMGFCFVWNNRECRLLSRSHPAACSMDITAFLSLTIFWVLTYKMG
jgi:hypothetical protein